MYVGRPRPFASMPVSRPRKNERLLPANLADLSVAFDLATHRGYDSDHPRVVGDVGKAGVDRQRRVYEDPLRPDPLDDTNLSMTMNGAVGLDPRELYRCRRRAGGRPTSCGHVQNDILKEFMVRNTHIRPHLDADHSDIIGFARRTCRSSTRSRFPATTCRKRAPRRCRSCIHAGRWTKYVRAALAAGFNDFAPRLSFFLLSA